MDKTLLVNAGCRKIIEILMSKQNINVETASATLKFFLQFLNHVLNWMLLCQEGSPNQVLRLMRGNGQI